MKILVCLKVIKGEINPFDEAALECALRLSDDVTVLSMCPESAESVLLPLTRIGAKVVLVSDSVYAGSDTLATSYILGTAAKKIGYDLILCGRQTIDGDTAQVGPMLSVNLNTALITNAMEVEVLGTEVAAKTRLGEEKANLPAVVTLERSYVLRFPSLFSRLGEVTKWTNKDLECDIEKCGLSGSPTKVLKVFENERGKRHCKFIKREELLPLIEELRKKEDITEAKTECETKLKSVWAVGDEVLEKAHEISEEVIKIEKQDPEKIAELAKDKKPDVILFNADLWGRRNAPVLAALLNTGLCADCIRLETDGEKLFMYRPAQGGNITAKIECRTYPQMATVRTKQESSDIIVSGGKGVIDSLDRLESFAKEIGAELGASRGLVDSNKAPYERQIGLTGKIVSPKIYIAIGISGAAHHTCGFEGAGTVIAINPDKEAKIFDFADYGILDEF